MAERAVAIDLGDVTALAARFAGAPAVLEAESLVAMQRSTIAIQGDAREAAPVDTGLLRNSIAAEAMPWFGTVGTNVAYAEAVHEGRRPGAPMPPQGALLPWMERHGLAAKLEFAIRRGIARRGIPARRFLADALRANLGTVEREFQAAAARFVARVLGGR